MPGGINDGFVGVDVGRTTNAKDLFTLEVHMFIDVTQVVGPPPAQGSCRDPVERLATGTRVCIHLAGVRRWWRGQPRLGLHGPTPVRNFSL